MAYPKCQRCLNPMHTAKRAEDRPDGTVQAAARGLCNTCYQREKRHSGGFASDPVTARPPVSHLNDFHDQPWSDQALCNQTDPEAFFPEKGGSTREAKQVCNGNPDKHIPPCPVRAECLDWALATEQRFGIWGGHSERERRKLKKQEPELAPTGTEGPTMTTTDSEQPAPRSYGLAYIGGAHAHRPIPLATDIGVRPTHKPKAPRPTGLDWSKHTAPEPEKPATQAVEQVLRCRWCRQPADTLVDDVCDGCRHDAEQQFHAPDNTPEESWPTTVSTAPSTSATPAPRSSVSTTTAAAAAADDPAPPTTKTTPGTTAPTTATPTTSAPSTTKTVSTSASTAATGPDVVDYCARLLRDTAASSDPLVQMLRGSALSVLAALDHAHHPTETPVAVPSSTRETATGPNKPSRRPANRTHNGPQRLQLPADTVDRYQAGTSTTQLAADLGVSIPTIRRWLLEHGVQLRAARVDYSPELIEAVRTRYHDQHMTQGEIATDLDVSTKVVQTAMNLAGIDRREAKARVAADNARGLKARIAALGVTSRDIKTWALAHGLVDQIARGLPGTALVDAYAEAHPPTRKENQPA